MGVEEVYCHYQARGVEGYFGAFVVGGGCSDASGTVAEYGKSGNVERSPANPFVWFSFKSDAKGERVAIDFFGVETANGASCDERKLVACVDERVDVV